MSETPKRMKSAAIRADWKNVLDAVQNGEEIVVEQYNRPVARIIPYQEPSMYTVETRIGPSLINCETSELDGTPEEVAKYYAETVADGTQRFDTVRVRVWEGESADRSTVPDAEHVVNSK